MRAGRTSLHRSARDSLGKRIRKKLLAKSSWFKKRGGAAPKTGGAGGLGLGGVKTTPVEQDSEPRSVLFVEQTPGGELAKRLREQIKTLQPIMGFNIKVVERAGSSLRSRFPLTNLWEGVKCPRVACVPCTQEGVEQLATCVKRNVLYENICLLCNPGAGAKGELKELKAGVPSVYIGESHRSLSERIGEHWEQYRKGGAEAEHNHIHKHMRLHHEELPVEQAKFAIKPVRYFTSALKRQVAEAVRIRRRGEGAVLNSKSEYNRCELPRLTVDLKEPAVEPEGPSVQEVLMEKAMVGWEKELSARRVHSDKELWRNRTGPACGAKRSGAETVEPPVRRAKKLRFSLLEEGWGERSSILVETGQEPVTPVEQHLVELEGPNIVEQELGRGQPLPTPHVVNKKPLVQATLPFLPVERTRRGCEGGSRTLWSKCLWS